MQGDLQRRLIPLTLHDDPGCSSRDEPDLWLSRVSFSDQGRKYGDDMSLLATSPRNGQRIILSLYVQASRSFGVLGWVW